MITHFFIKMFVDGSDFGLEAEVVVVQLFPARLKLLAPRVSQALENVQLFFPQFFNEKTVLVDPQDVVKVVEGLTSKQRLQEH